MCIYVDLHGHSRKHNVFMYGCHTPKADHTQFLYERLLPFLLSEQVDHDPRSIPLIKAFLPRLLTCSVWRVASLQSSAARSPLEEWLLGDLEFPTASL